MNDGFPQSVLIVAGEPSGERAAARVAQSVLERNPCRMFGVGGEQMKLAGVELLAEIDELTALGVAESVKRLGRWLKAWAAIRAEVDRRKPSVALLVDAPEINLPLARALTMSGVKVVFYVGPQIWAWRRGRLGLLKERTDVVALVLPFEKPLYDRKGVKAVFVGHPILDEPPPKPKAVVRSWLGAAPSDLLLAFLPGSRPGEVSRHSPQMISAARSLRQRGIKSVFAPPMSAAADPTLAGAKTADMAIPPAGCSARDVLAASDAAVVASGTATLEAVVSGVPMAVVYVLDQLSWAAGRALIDIPYVSLPNWIAGRAIVPELLQGDFFTDALIETADLLLRPEERDRQRRELARVVSSLGEPGAARRVASLVLERLR